MIYVLDAAVVVAALRAGEPSHATALRRCTAFFAGVDEVVVPAIFDVEVASALLRRGAATATVEALFSQHFASRRLVTIGPRAATSARRVASLTKLRAADALYVWVARHEGLPLVTLEQEILQRAPLAGVVASLP